MSQPSLKKKTLASPLPLGEGPASVFARRAVRQTGSSPSKVLLARARELRKTATEAETLLCNLIRNRQINSAKFRRQHSFGPYILDFYRSEARLVIELDGGGHAEPQQAHHDAERTEALNAAGIRVIRFWNNQIFKETEAVLQVIFDALDADALTLKP